jgi:hypothetical protein
MKLLGFPMLLLIAISILMSNLIIMVAAVALVFLPLLFRMDSDLPVSSNEEGFIVEPSINIEIFLFLGSMFFLGFFVAASIVQGFNPIALAVLLPLFLICIIENVFYHWTFFDVTPFKITKLSMFNTKTIEWKDVDAVTLESNGLMIVSGRTRIWGISDDSMGYTELIRFIGDNLESTKWVKIEREVGNRGNQRRH